MWCTLLKALGLNGATPNLCTFLTFTRLNLTRSTLHTPGLHDPKFTRPPNLHDSYLHAQIYTTPNLHKIYTTPHLHKSNLHAPKSTQNKHSNLLWFDHQNIAWVQKLSLPFSVSIRISSVFYRYFIGILSVFYRYFIGIIISIRTINSICSICSINSINSICSICSIFPIPSIWLIDWTDCSKTISGLDRWMDGSHWEV